MILMKYHTLFLLKTRKDVKKILLSAAVVIGALRVKIQNQQFDTFCINMYGKIHQSEKGLLTLCMPGNFACFLSSADFFQNQLF